MVFSRYRFRGDFETYHDAKDPGKDHKEGERGFAARCAEWLHPSGVLPLFKCERLRLEQTMRRQSLQQ
jgi:hypothetical protein